MGRICITTFFILTFALYHAGAVSAGTRCVQPMQGAWSAQPAECTCSARPMPVTRAARPAEATRSVQPAARQGSARPAADRKDICVKMRIEDAASEEPVAFATVYLKPEGDSTIAHFTMSDAQGNAIFKDVAGGKYVLGVEMIGYRPFSGEYVFSRESEELGTIRLEEQAEAIDAATITAVGNPVEVSRDTVTFNASSFPVEGSAVLEDLLKKLPGMEVSEDGTVRLNGEKIDRITVGGKTFFFNDLSAAMKNLPAKIIEKIKVVDRKKEYAEFSGIATADDKEKVIDIQLKEEYSHGWFGNAMLSGGAGLSSAGNGQAGRKGFLYDGRAMASGYNENNDIVLIANGNNISKSGNDYVISAVDDELASKDGITSSSLAGANLNTSAIKGMDTNVAVNYKYAVKDVVERTDRQSSLSSDSDIRTEGTYNGKGRTHHVSANIETKAKNTDRWLIYANPVVSFSTNDRNISSISSSTDGNGGTANTSMTSVVSVIKHFATNGYTAAGLKGLGKERRNFIIYGNWYYYGTRENRMENIFLTEAAPSSLAYDNRSVRWAAEGIASYVEPISSSWALQARFTMTYLYSDMDKSASDADGSVNPYYSTWSQNTELFFRERFVAQYEHGSSLLHLGFQTDERKSINKAVSLGQEYIYGNDRWLLDWTPYINFMMNRESSYFNVRYQSYSSRAEGSKIVPAPDLSSAAQISVGNIYLMPDHNHSLDVSFRYNNKEKYSYLDISLYGVLSRRNIVNATWFDAAGTRYAVPVNSKKPGADVTIRNVYSRPLDRQRRLTLSLQTWIKYTLSTGYQSVSRKDPLDIGTFIYEGFMSDFWGSPDGERFYSGGSGFSESRTNNLKFVVYPELKYSLERFSATAEMYVQGDLRRYSLDSSADSRSMALYAGSDLLYSTKKGLEFKTDIGYKAYFGYAAGFGSPELLWNLSVSKSIKAFTISLKMNDILGRRQGISRMVADEYVLDTESLVMGRYVLLGISLDFGKANAQKKSSTRDAVQRIGRW